MSRIREFIFSIITISLFLLSGYLSSELKDSDWTFGIGYVNRVLIEMFIYMSIGFVIGILSNWRDFKVSYNIKALKVNYKRLIFLGFPALITVLFILSGLGLIPRLDFNNYFRIAVAVADSRSLIYLLFGFSVGSSLIIVEEYETKASVGKI